jgi:hypothetical protein
MRYIMKFVHYNFYHIICINCFQKASIKNNVNVYIINKINIEVTLNIRTRIVKSRQM